jgi:hypothetical protein
MIRSTAARHRSSATARLPPRKADRRKGGRDRLAGWTGLERDTASGDNFSIFRGLDDRLRPSSGMRLHESRPPDDASRRLTRPVAEPMLEDFENAIVWATLQSRGDVAEQLTRALRRRCEEATHTVLPSRPNRHG